ncbi:MAG: carbohydrate ABC transporter substrate-binding protein [Anaerolineales bacterium]|nr:carbohydrate ABC transporter substrate-binding protein [Anaerolineales bacterium]
MKRLSTILSVLIALSILLTACGSAPAATEAPLLRAATDAPAAAPAELEGTLKVWSFTNDTYVIATAFKELHPKVNIEFTMIPMNGGEFQTKVRAAAGTADAPDVVALEAAFVREWVEADGLLADQSDLLPLTKELKSYQAGVDVGTYDGMTKAYTFESTPGAFFYRRSLAKECLGTDDPEKIQAMVSDLDKFVEVSAKIKGCGTGDYFMVGTAGELSSPFFTTREQPWVVDGALTIDPKVVEYVHFAKMMRDNGYESGAGQWSEGWFAGMNDTLKDASGTPKKVFSYFLPTWGLPYVLINNAKAKDGSSDTSGDWAMVQGPMAYQWGGTWIGALEGSEQSELAKEFVKFSCLDEEFLTKLAQGYYTNEKLKEIDPTVPDSLVFNPGDFVSSQLVVENIIPSFDNSSAAEFLGGQRSIRSICRDSLGRRWQVDPGTDDAIQRALGDPLGAYLGGTMTEAEMWAAFLTAVGNENPDLVLPEPPVK